MHSSIINKIRILKPRKKPGVQSNIIATKSFTINNDNCHSSIVLQGNVSNDKPPPLEPPPNDEPDKPINKWVPFYVVNVPKVNFDEVKLDAQNTNSDENNESSSSAQQLTINASKQNMNPESDTGTSKSHLSESSEENWVSAQNMKDNVTVSQRTTRPRNVKGNNHSVNCFLCPTTFDSVKEMQDHYLENHKHKKRTNNSNNSAKAVTKKANKTSKPKDPLKITEEDTGTGDGEPKCPICSIYFKTKDEVKNHMTNVHCYKCSECDNTFYTLFQFTDHRCSKYVVKKRPKLRKKKLKSDPVKDPLALQIPPRRFVNILPKNAHMLPTSSSSSSSSSYPLILNYPVRDETILSQAHISSTQTGGDTAVSSSVNLETLSNQSTSENNNNNNNESNNINNNNSNNNNNAVHGNSLLNCSLEELTSKEFNKMKLNEIINNPHLSINWIPKKNPEPSESSEFFSCGRCNVLCEDNSDYVEHLEECLRLSNVSMLESSTSERLLNLKSEIIPQKNIQNTKTTINKMLLKELRNIIGPEKSELFDFKCEEEEEMASQVESLNGNTNKSDFVHPDIKGNISITRINPINEHLKSSDHFIVDLKSSEFPDPKKLPIEIIQSLHHPTRASTVLNTSMKRPLSSQQPMVIIPLNNSEKGNQIVTKQRELDHPDYPNISITDKSNSVTWNFIGSEQGAILRVESPYQRNSCPDMNKSVGLISLGQNKIVHLPMSSLMSLKSANKISNPMTSSNSPENIQEPELSTLKMEPMSPANEFDKSLDEMDKSPLSSDDFKDNCSSMELVLDEEEIKMEVEEEVVDDQF